MGRRPLVLDSHCHAGKGDGLTGPWDTDAPLRDYLRRARAAGIDGTVVFAPFTSDYEQANQEVASIVRSHPRRLLGYAFVDAGRDRGRVADLVAEAVLVHGFRGLKVHRHDAALTREVLEVARDWRLPILYDVMGEVTALELIAREYPSVPLVVPHLGSFADDWTAQRAFIDILVRHPNVFTDTSGVRRFDLLVEAVNRAGPHKVLFGSDGPWLHPGVELAKVDALRLDDRGFEAVVSGNLLGLVRRVRRVPPGPDQELSAKWHWHHIYPQALRDKFKKIGIDVHDFTIKIPPRQHLGVVHGGGWYNRWWDEWLKKPGRTAGGAKRASLALFRNHPRLAPLRLDQRVVKPYPRELELGC